MNFTVEMPVGKESAQNLLRKFMELATQRKYSKEFGKAVEILYGCSYRIKTDLSNRMCFVCEICHKDMNSVKALHEHSTSGQHLKNEDSMLQKKQKKIKVFHKQDDESLSKISNQHLQFIDKIRHSSVVIIGLQYIEAYDDSKGRIYYKCNLCGAHGKGDSMYNHVIGDSHTDKYIGIRLHVDNATYGPNVRNEARQKISRVENFSVEDIAVIKGKHLYPYKWQSEGSRPKPNPQRKEFDFNLLNKQTGNEKPEKNSLHPPSTSGQNFMSYLYFEKILLKFSAIVHFHLDEATDLHSPYDLRFCLLLHIYILHHLFYVVKRLIGRYKNVDDEKYKFYTEQHEHLKTALGYLCLKITEDYTRKYSEAFGDLPRFEKKRK